MKAQPFITEKEKSNAVSSRTASSSSKNSMFRLKARSRNNRNTHTELMVMGGGLDSSDVTSLDFLLAMCLSSELYSHACS